MEKLKDLQPVARLIPDNIGPDQDCPADQSVQKTVNEIWPRCAGRAALESFPLLFRSGRLVVYTESAIWATELRHLHSGIMDAMQSLGVNKVDVRTTPRLFPQPESARAVTSVSKRNQQGIAVTARRLQHPGLQHAVERLAQKASEKS